jgi:uroporphyrinogen decarboxylase
MSPSDFQQSIPNENNQATAETETVFVPEPKLLLDILGGDIANRPAFWFMRQAGRYLPEYREIRSKEKTFLDLVFNPEKAAEITLQPIRRFGMDAAILFSDILVVPHALQQKVTFLEDIGPKLDPIREVNDLGKLDAKKIKTVLEPINETIRLVRKQLPSNAALIGFCGAPWTVASYMVEGGASKDYIHSKKWAYRDPKGFSYLLTIIQETSLEYLTMQIEAGAEAIMIFDSHAGQLPPALFDPLIIKPTQKLIKSLRERYPKIPIIGFPRGLSPEHILKYVKETGVTAIQIDELTSYKWAYDELSMLLPIQGNIDPAVLLSGGEVLKKTAINLMNRFCDRPFIINLGHGVHKNTPIKHVEYLANLVKDFSNVSASIEMMAGGY